MYLYLNEFICSVTRPLSSLSNQPLFQPVMVLYTLILFVLDSSHAVENDIFKSSYLKIVQEAWRNVKIHTCHLCCEIISVISTCQLFLRSQINTTVICMILKNGCNQGKSIRSSLAGRVQSSEALRPLFLLHSHLISSPPLSAETVG